MQPIMAIMGTLALGHSLFLGLFFWRKSTGLQLSNRLFAGLLFALAIRVTKSVLLVLYPGLGDIAPLFGLIGMAFIGPLLLLYLLSVLDLKFRWIQKQAFHFTLPMILILLIPFMTEVIIYHCYQLTLVQMGAYLLSSLFVLLKERSTIKFDPQRNKWLRLLFGAVTAIWITFLLQIIVESNATYILVTTCATTVLYGLSFWGMKRMGVFSKNKKNHQGIFQSINSNNLATQIEHVFEEEKLYTDSQLTVARLADHLQVPAYQVSRTINEVFGKTFPVLLNEYRIAESAKRLVQSDFNYLSIEGIANESGFNSLSAFYTAFKRIKGVTPAEWRKKKISS